MLPHDIIKFKVTNKPKLDLVILDDEILVGECYEREIVVFKAENSAKLLHNVRTKVRMFDFNWDGPDLRSVFMPDNDCIRLENNPEYDFTRISADTIKLQLESLKNEQEALMMQDKKKPSLDKSFEEGSDAFGDHSAIQKTRTMGSTTDRTHKEEEKSSVKAVSLSEQLTISLTNINERICIIKQDNTGQEQTSNIPLQEKFGKFVNQLPERDRPDMQKAMGHANKNLQRMGSTPYSRDSEPQSKPRISITGFGDRLRQATTQGTGFIKESGNFSNYHQDFVKYKDGKVF